MSHLSLSQIQNVGEPKNTPTTLWHVNLNNRVNIDWIFEKSAPFSSSLDTWKLLTEKWELCKGYVYISPEFDKFICSSNQCDNLDVIRDISREVAPKLERLDCFNSDVWLPWERSSVPLSFELRKRILKLAIVIDSPDKTVPFQLSLAFWGAKDVWKERIFNCVRANFLLIIDSSLENFARGVLQNGLQSPYKAHLLRWESKTICRQMRTEYVTITYDEQSENEQSEHEWESWGFPGSQQVAPASGSSWEAGYRVGDDEQHVSQPND